MISWKVMKVKLVIEACDCIQLLNLVDGIRGLYTRDRKRCMWKR